MKRLVERKQTKPKKMNNRHGKQVTFEDRIEVEDKVRLLYEWSKWAGITRHAIRFFYLIHMMPGVTDKYKM